MTKGQFYLHTLADHWQESGHPYAADLLRHHANEGVHQFRDLPGSADMIDARTPDAGGPAVFVTPDLQGHGQAKVTLYHTEYSSPVTSRRLGSFPLPADHAVGVIRRLHADGMPGILGDLSRVNARAQIDGIGRTAGTMPQLNTAKPEAPEQDYRPDSVLPEDFYGYSRKRKYAAIADGGKAAHFLRALAGHWRDLGYKAGSDVALHLANQADPFVSEHPNDFFDGSLTNWLHANGGKPVVRAGRISDQGTRLAFFVPGGTGGTVRRLPFLVLPHHQAFALMTKLAKEKFQGARTAADQIMYNGTGPDGKKLLRRDGGEHNLPPLDTRTGQEDAEPPTPEDFLHYSRARLARAKARHDGRKAARKLARRVGVRRYANEHTPGFADWFAGSKVVGSDGRPLRVYHGTQRGDRIGTALVKGRATSGPMPFFTDDPEIASSYATGKADTSLESPPYEEQFTVKVPGQRRPVPLVRAWHLLPAADRQRIASLAPRVGMGDDSEPTLHPPGHASGSGGYDYHIREARGNHLAALVEEWLNSGNLFNEEHRFPDVLQLAGLSHPVQYHDPHAVRSSVLPAYLSMRNPLDTTAVPPAVVSALARAAGRQRPARRGGADFWDKNTRDAREWARQLADDVSAGANSHVWTSIPDWVTRTLRGLGYDGIKDTGGKQGGQGHTVYVPFHPSQVKSAIANRGSFDPRARKLTLAREKPLTVPIHAILPDKENLEVAADSLHRGHRSEDTRPLEVYRVGKRFVLADGHHRLLQAILAGDTTATVSPRETDRPPGTKYTVPLDPDADLYGLPDRLPRNGWLLKRLKLGRRRKYSHRAFGEQMRAEPGNGTHPLVWADYLQEQGHDEAADVVRRHVAIAGRLNGPYRAMAHTRAMAMGLNRPWEPFADARPSGYTLPSGEPAWGVYVGQAFPDGTHPHVSTHHAFIFTSPAEAAQLLAGMARSGLHGAEESLGRVRSLQPDGPQRMARPYRAPAGGTVVRGVFYEGGSLLPDLTGAFATGQTPSRPASPPKSRKINWAAALRRWTGRQRNR